MKKSIILTDSDYDAKRVFDSVSLNTIKTETQFLGTYSKSAFIENADSLRDVSYVFSTWGMPHFSDEEIKLFFPALECVFYAAGSVQGFAKEFIEAGIHVFSAWGANAVPVAEYTVAQIILANKGFFSSYITKHNIDYSNARKVFGEFCGNYNVKVGIIGVGMIGKLVLEMLKAYSIDALVFDPFLPDSYITEHFPKGNVKKASLEEIFSQCSVISNHLANNDETAGMLDYSLFSLMKPYAVFLNTGRGRQVNENDLIRALSEDESRCALLDVTFPEPPCDDSKLYDMKNIILTPHIAGSAGNEVVRMAQYMIDEFRLYKDNKPCKYEVTSQMLKTMA